MHLRGAGLIAIGEGLRRVLALLFFFSLARASDPAVLGSIAVASLMLQAWHFAGHAGLGAVYQTLGDTHSLAAARSVAAALGIGTTVLMTVSFPLVLSVLGIEAFPTLGVAVAAALLPIRLLEIELARLELSGQYARSVLLYTAASTASIIVALSGLALEILSPMGAFVVQVLLQEYAALGLLFPRRPRFSLARAPLIQIWRRSRPLLGAAIVDFVNSNVDDIVVARAFGTAGLGAYSVAYRASNVAPNLIGSAIQRSLLPALLSGRDDPDSGAKQNVVVVRSILYAAAVLFVVQAWVLGPVLGAIFGDDYDAATLIAVALTGYAFGRLIQSLIMPYAHESGRQRVIRMTSLMRFGLALPAAGVYVTAGLVPGALAMSLAVILPASWGLWRVVPAAGRPIAVSVILIGLVTTSLTVDRGGTDLQGARTLSMVASALAVLLAARSLGGAARYMRARAYPARNETGRP